MEMKVLTSDEIKAVASFVYPSPTARLAFVALLVGNRHNIFHNISSSIAEAVRTIITDPVRRETTLYGDAKRIIETICLQCMSSRIAALEASHKGIEAIGMAQEVVRDICYTAPEVLYPHHWRIYNGGIAVLFNVASVPMYRVTMGDTCRSRVEKATLMLELADVPVRYVNIPMEYDVPEKTSAKKLTGKVVSVQVSSQIPLTRIDNSNLNTLIACITHLLLSQGVKVAAADPDRQDDFAVELACLGSNHVTYYENNPTSYAVAGAMEQSGFQPNPLSESKRKSHPYVFVGMHLSNTDPFEADAEIRRVATKLAYAIAEALK